MGCKLHYMENKDISQLRKSYDKNKLNVKDVNFQPVEFLNHGFKTHLKIKNIEEANAMTLTTLGLDKFQREESFCLNLLRKRVLFFLLIMKVKREYLLTTTQKLDYRFFGPPLERQIIIKGEIEKISPEDSDDYFSSRPKSQISALISEQSKVIKSREILEQKMDMMEKKYSGKEIKRPDNWGGYLVKPKSFEFWQGRPNRLHDRILCTLLKNSWDIKRLSP